MRWVMRQHAWLTLAVQALYTPGLPTGGRSCNFRRRFHNCASFPCRFHEPCQQHSCAFILLNHELSSCYASALDVVLACTKCVFTLPPSNICWGSCKDQLNSMQGLQ